MVFAAVVGGALRFAGVELVFQESPVEDAGPDQAPVDPTLSTQELVRFGQGALAKGDTINAQRFYDAARLKIALESDAEINLVVDVFEGLARVEELEGRDKVAKMYREYTRSRQAELGESLPLFNKAERLHREKDYQGAREHFARFLLMSSTLGDAAGRYVQVAKKRIADSFEAELMANSNPQEVESLANPEEFFRGR